MMDKKAAITLIAAILLSNSAECFSIGTAPGVLDLGEVKPGTEVDFTFYLVSNAGSDILVHMTPMKAHETLFRVNHTGRYMFIADQASQKDVSTWLNIKRNPLVVSPKNTFVVQLTTGGTVRANAKVDATIKIPKNAEPCYYMSSVNPSPSLTQGQGMGISTIGLTRFMYVFKVIGEAVRKGEIVDIVAKRTGQGEVRLDILFKNTGTCTIEAWAEETKVYDELGEPITVVQSGSTKIAPGDITVLSAYWRENVSEGRFRVDARVNYVTGKTFREETIIVPKEIFIEEKGPAVTGCSFPWWILLVIVILVLLLLWRTDTSASTVLKAAAIMCLVVVVYGAITCPSSIPWAWFLGAVVITLVVVYLKT